MIWNDADFQKTYRARLRCVQTSGDAELQAQAMAFQAEAAKAGGSSGEHFTRRAGAVASILLSGYVARAIDAFDQAIAAVEAELVEADLNALRSSLEQEIARRAKSLPATLRDFTKPAAPPALLRAILEEAPVKARRLLAERISAAHDRVRAQAPIVPRELPDRAVFISHHTLDAALADALRSAIRAAIGDDAALCTSSDLGDGFPLMRKNRMTLALLTPHSLGHPLFWWTLGVAEGAGTPLFALRAAAVSDDVALPLRAQQIIDLTRREQIVQLLRSIQMELRRRGKDLSELDLDPLLREAAR
jgi:hypothetical protein